MAERVQLKRTKGWRMPPDTVKVDRSTRFGNRHNWQEWLEDARSLSHSLQSPAERKAWACERALNAFEEDVRDGLVPDVSELRGKNLACWCRPGAPCHADVLLELAAPKEGPDG